MGTTDGGGEELPRAGSGGGGGEEKIFVSVRLRPLNEKEIARRDASDWECINDNAVIFKNSNLPMPERSMYPTAYSFDRVFRSDCSTRQVYEEGAKKVALSVVSGINSSVFAYGQTSSGKTFTMSGITEYTITDIYDYIEKHTEREFILKFSAMEIYNESVRDLLSADSTPLRLLDDPERGTTVEKLTEETLRDWDHVMELLSVCEAQRQIGETSLNESSSRSHQIIRLTIESSTRVFLGKDKSSTLAASVNFVDLAGSERASQSLTAGTRLKEGCHINRSLLTLGTVIRKLSKGRNGHIPFRDSKLTRILQSSLEGNARTAIICTMSPARSHVEQSRNTLLFASCAKEVTTNAQVNVVMSDKALVKHLQRELTRMENELRSSRPTFVTPDFPALLREKDIQIEKLEKEMIDLTRQRDVAQAQVQDLFRLVQDLTLQRDVAQAQAQAQVEDDRDSTIWVRRNEYPNLRVRRSPDSKKTSILANPHSLDAHIRKYDTSQFSDEHTGSSSDDHYIHLPEFEENFVSNDVSPQRLSCSNSIGSDSHQGWDEIEEQSTRTSEDLCKEVRCIETEDANTPVRCIETEVSNMTVRCFETVDSNITDQCFETEDSSITVRCFETENSNTIVRCIKTEDLNTTRHVESNQLSPEVNNGIFALKVIGDGDRADQEVVSPPLIEDSVLSCVSPLSVVLSPQQPPPWKLTEDSFRSRSLKLTKSRSCEENLMISLSSPWSDEIEKHENTPANGFEKKFTGRPEGFPRKLSSLDYGTKVESLIRQDSQSSSESAAADEVEAHDGKTSTDDNFMSTEKCVEGVKEMDRAQHEKQVAVDLLAEETEPKDNTASKNFKDIGLDPIEDDPESLSDWPSEFKRLQREIIELWNACNVSLVHRTYFFLLFNGDPADSIYMQVELRRLSFLKETFSRGCQTVEDGRILTPASSKKALRREREMLTREMQKKLTEDDREWLYLKWGIGFNTKYRRLQLANRLWTDSEDMDHIADSAVVVAKLIGFIEPGKAPKEMFGLNFIPRRAYRSYSLKHKVISLL